MNFLKLKNIIDILFILILIFITYIGINVDRILLTNNEEMNKAFNKIYHKELNKIVKLKNLKKTFGIETTYNETIFPFLSKTATFSYCSSLHFLIDNKKLYFKEEDLKKHSKEDFINEAGYCLKEVIKDIDFKEKIKLIKYNKEKQKFIDKPIDKPLDYSKLNKNDN